MVDIWQAVRCVRALLAFLVAVALLVAPVASVQAMPCHDRGGHEHSTAPERSAVLTIHDHDGLQGSDRIADHVVCCGSMCSSCLVAMGMEPMGMLDPVGSSQHFEWSNLLGNSVALSPNLDPPRLEV